MNRKRGLLLLSIGAGVLAAGGLAFVAYAGGGKKNAPDASPMHPAIALLDEAGRNVLSSGSPVSTMQTCGQCHDTKFIAAHDFHSNLGLSDLGRTPTARPWDLGAGPFGKWDPLTYRYLSAPGDTRLDLGTSDWIRTHAARFVGGGPGVLSRTGQSLPTGDPNAEGWDWAKSGVLETDCFLCHIAGPDNPDRVRAIQRGDFRSAATASLVGTGLILTSADGSMVWNPDAFTSDGKTSTSLIQNPTDENCALCHGLVHRSTAPLVLAGCDLANWETATTGEVISDQKISNSGMNLSGKQDLTRSWDVHAERGLSCTDCHYSPNNPAYAKANSDLAYLTFDPRRLDIGAYLQKPDHNLALSRSAQGSAAGRTCESCHDAAGLHTWLPYAQQHMQRLACESCHAPKVYAPALQSVDWTVVRQNGQPVTTCRGVTGSTGTIKDLVTGFEPVLLPRKNDAGTTQLAPYNLVSSWYWVYESEHGPRPVRQSDLLAAYVQGSGYAPDVIKALDTDGNGVLSEGELILDTSAKQAFIAERLARLGLRNPHIEAEVDPYSINHDVAGVGWATKDCRTCHSDSSRLSRPIALANVSPGGVSPRFVADTRTSPAGTIVTQAGSLFYQPTPTDEHLYVFGHSRVAWVDWAGVAFFAAVLVAVAAHAGFRFFTSLRAHEHASEVDRVYMYAVYERFWHWLQTSAILILLFTGLVIHRPDVFRVFSFPYVVVVHNVLAVLLVINAGLSLFYHLVSGEIRQYLPRPYGFFDDAIVQAKFYLRGIFKGEAHPFDKLPNRKLNPLQQVTYFAIMTVLLPLQIATGALMMGVQYIPRISTWFGGLPALAPFHSLVAWTFAAFVVGHVYLTTTGPRVLSSINAMMLGWEDVEMKQPRVVGETGRLPEEVV